MVFTVIKMFNLKTIPTRMGLFLLVEYIQLLSIFDFSKSFNSSLKSELASIFTSNQEIVAKHFRYGLENSLVALGLPEANIERSPVIGNPLIVFLDV